MSDAKDTSTAHFQRYIFLFGIISCVAFILVFFALRIFNMDYSGGVMVPVDCIALSLISFYEIKNWDKKTGTPLPFLRSFSLVFFTGICAFVLLGGFMLVYSQINTGAFGPDQMSSSGKIIFTPVMVTVAEGIGGSIIVALIGMMYADRFYDHEAKPKMKKCELYKL